MKKLLYVFFAVALVFGMAACKKESQNQPEETTTNSGSTNNNTKKATIKFEFKSIGDFDAYVSVFPSSQKLPYVVFYVDETYYKSEGFDTDKEGGMLKYVQRLQTQFYKSESASQMTFIEYAGRKGNWENVQIPDLTPATKYYFIGAYIAETDDGEASVSGYSEKAFTTKPADVSDLSIDLQVSDITDVEAIAKITVSHQSMPYWFSFMDHETYVELGLGEDPEADMQHIVENEASYYINLYKQYGYNITIEELLPDLTYTGSLEKMRLIELDPEKEYDVVAFYVFNDGENLNFYSFKHAQFTTADAEKSEMTLNISIKEDKSALVITPSDNEGTYYWGIFTPKQIEDYGAEYLLNVNYRREVKADATQEYLVKGEFAIDWYNKLDNGQWVVIAAAHNGKYVTGEIAELTYTIGEVEGGEEGGNEESGNGDQLDNNNQDNEGNPIARRLMINRTPKTKILKAVRR